MQGEYIVDRLLPTLVADACAKLGFECARFSDDWVIRIDGNGKRRWIIGYTFDINGAGAVGVASDKVATSLVLSADGIPAVMHYLVRTHSEQNLLTENIAHLNENALVVIKPLSGSGGRGVMLMPSQAAAVEYIRSSTHPDWALSPYYNIVSEKRAIVLDGRVLCAYDKTKPYVLAGLKMFNLGLGAVAVNCELTSEEASHIGRANDAIGLRTASLDIATLDDGQPVIMEINSGITMEHYARQSEEYSDIAAGVYFKIVKAMMS